MVNHVDYFSETVNFVLFTYIVFRGYVIFKHFAEVIFCRNEISSEVEKASNYTKIFKACFIVNRILQN